MAAATEEKVGRTRRVGGFISEVRAEMYKVTWPTRGELYGATVVVVAVTIALSMFLGFSDFLFGSIIEFVMTRRG